MLCEQPLRQTQDLMRFIAKLLGVDITESYFTTISHKSHILSLSAKTVPKSAEKSVQLAVDSTGLKIFGQRNGWRKSMKQRGNGAYGACCTLALILSVA
jgi:hypothetical protein